MSKLAEKIIDVVLDRDKDDIAIDINVYSKKYNCNVTYRLSEMEIRNNHVPILIQSMISQLKQYIALKGDDDAVS